MQPVAAENKIRHHLVLEGKSYGYWDADAVEFGGEVITDYDPELGEVNHGGRQKGGEMSLSRLWARGREWLTFKELLPLRLKARGYVAAWEFDDDEQPISSEPLATMACLLTAVTKPASSAAGSASAKIEIKVQVDA